MKEVKFVLYGGCVTRDTFSVDRALQERSNIVKYFSRSTLASIANKPFEFPGDISKYGKFESRIAREDAQKSFATFLGQSLISTAWFATS